MYTLVFGAGAAAPPTSRFGSGAGVTRPAWPIPDPARRGSRRGTAKRTGPRAGSPAAGRRVSGEQRGDEHQVGHGGGDHEGVEDLVEPEHRGPRVRPLPGVDDGADAVEHAAGGQEGEADRV